MHINSINRSYREVLFHSGSRILIGIKVPFHQFQLTSGNWVRKFQCSLFYDLYDFHPINLDQRSTTVSKEQAQTLTKAGLQPFRHPCPKKINFVQSNEHNESEQKKRVNVSSCLVCKTDLQSVSKINVKFRLTQFPCLLGELETVINIFIHCGNDLCLGKCPLGWFSNVTLKRSFYLVVSIQQGTKHCNALVYFNENRLYNPRSNQSNPLNTGFVSVCAMRSDHNPFIDGLLRRRCHQQAILVNKKGTRPQNVAPSNRSAGESEFDSGTYELRETNVS